VNDIETILVTGGAGFVGSHLADALLDRGYSVIVVDNLSGGKEALVPDEAIFYNQDLTTGVPDIDSVDAVFHLAAQTNVRTSFDRPAQDARSNIIGTLNLAQWALDSGVKQFVFFSSGGALYDPAAALPYDESSPIAPQSPYGLSKHTAERYLHQRIPEDMLLTILRPSNIYGPRQYTDGEGGVIAKFINRALAGRTLDIYGDGKQTRDFVYVDDVIRAAVETMQERISGVFNVSTNQAVSVNDIVRQLKQALAEELSVVHEEPIAGEVRESKLSSAQLQSFGWQPEVSLSEGIKQIIAYERS